MSKQHFYSRVPARMSIFNRTDGFDTFAYSEGLEREFIEKDLAAVYDNKPSKNDAVLIRTGKLPPIYCQYFTKSGVMVQGCLSFLPLDYTGERSAYLSHILVPDEDEIKPLLDNNENAAFNPLMFQTDLSGFSLTSLDSSPDRNYPPVAYQPVAAPETGSLGKYDSAMMKRLIFCLLNIACAKGKTVFLAMPYELADFSARSLEFINTLLQIFPYHLRRAFSFVTYTDDASRFSAFNVRFIAEGSPEIPATKGITLHFGSKIALGLTDDLVAQNGQLVEFFYSLIKNDAIRREFLYFTEKAIEAVPELKKTTLKTLTELVFLFQQCSGLFPEKAILPNDAKVYEFICAYEKHRKALNDEYRSVALTCLKRYPAGHLTIPKDVFSKISKIYPTEPTSSKRVVMNVVLELIHTDVMREKLFAFIKSNYAGEEPQNRSLICQNLSRVYYGGFLQLQILDFFESVFENESEESRNDIVEKLLLTVRTKSVSNKIVAFFDSQYDLLSDGQKQKLYTVFYEMLPDCDELTVELVGLVNRHIGSEPEELKNAAAEKIYTLCENNQRCKEPKLLPILISDGGFCCNAVIRPLFLSHSAHKIFLNFTRVFHHLSADRKLKLIKEIWETVPETDVSVAETFANHLCAVNEQEPNKYDLYTLIDFDAALSPDLDGSAPKSTFAKTVLENIIRPALCRALPEAFSVKSNRDGLQQAIKYCSDKPYITFSPDYKPIDAYVKFCQAAEQCQHDRMLEVFPLLNQKRIATGAAEHIKQKFLTGNAFSEENTLATRGLLVILVEYLKTHEFHFDGGYNDIRTKLYGISSASGTPDSGAEQEVARKSVAALFTAVQDIYLSETFSDSAEMLLSAGGPLEGVLNGFLPTQKKGAKWIDEYLTFHKFDPVFTQQTVKLANAVPVKSEGIFRKLFGRK